MASSRKLQLVAYQIAKLSAKVKETDRKIEVHDLQIYNIDHEIQKIINNLPKEDIPRPVKLEIEKICAKRQKFINIRKDEKKFLKKLNENLTILKEKYIDKVKTITF